MRHRACSMLAVTATLLAPVPALAAFQCPVAEMPATGNTPTLRADDMAGNEVAVSANLKSTIRRMQAQGMKSGEIVDRLVVADCSSLDADPNGSDDRKARQVRRFASKLARFVYTAPGQGEEDIVLDVPVPTPLYEHLRQAAEKAGVGEKAWIREAIAAKLGTP